MLFIYAIKVGVLFIKAEAQRKSRKTKTPTSQEAGVSFTADCQGLQATGTDLDLREIVTCTLLPPSQIRRSWLQPYQPGQWRCTRQPR